MEEALSPAQVCARFGISKSTLFRWEAEGHVPAPDRNLRGERQYTQSHLAGIARFVQSRRHRSRYAQIFNGEAQDARAKLVELGEQNALFKFVNLGDMTGLAELWEYRPLQPATIRELLKAALKQHDPEDLPFREIIDLVCGSLRQGIAEPV